jgi:hypothetical protein
MTHLWTCVGKLLLLLVIAPAIVAAAATLVLCRLHPWISAPH